MTVYVDNARLRYGRMVMSHMVADTHEELQAMVDAIGVSRRWLQHEGTPKEHYDICLSKRALALRKGAKTFDLQGLAMFLTQRRKEPPHA